MSISIALWMRSDYNWTELYARGTGVRVWWRRVDPKLEFHFRSDGFSKASCTYLPVAISQSSCVSVIPLRTWAGSVWMVKFTIRIMEWAPLKFKAGGLTLEPSKSEASLYAFCDGHFGDCLHTYGMLKVEWKREPVWHPMASATPLAIAIQAIGRESSEETIVFARNASNLLTLQRWMFESTASDSTRVWCIGNQRLPFVMFFLFRTKDTTRNDKVTLHLEGIDISAVHLKRENRPNEAWFVWSTPTKPFWWGKEVFVLGLTVHGAEVKADGVCYGTKVGEFIFDLSSCQNRVHGSAWLGMGTLVGGDADNLDGQDLRGFLPRRLAFVDQNHRVFAAVRHIMSSNSDTP